MIEYRNVFRRELGREGSGEGDRGKGRGEGSGEEVKVKVNGEVGGCYSVLCTLWF